MDQTKICYNCFCELQETVAECPHCHYNPEYDQGKNPLALPPGYVLCDMYILGRVLGQGGYGITYLAFDKVLGMKVAVKEYFPEIGATRDSSTYQVTATSVQKEEDYRNGKESFLREARVLASFAGNPNIVHIYGCFEENGTAYFAMDYVEGINLQSYIQEQGGRIAWKDAYEKFLPIIAALEDVHKQGIIHRDISPDNIYIASDGTVKLLDFGAARFQSLNQSHSLDVILKYGYTPVEQYNRRGKQGPYTDVYALCACFYASVTGELPPDATERIVRDTLLPFQAFGVEIPLAVEQVIVKGMSVLQENRYQTMGELRNALEDAVQEKNPVPPVPPMPQKKDVLAELLQKLKTMPKKYMAGIAAVCVCMLFLVFWFAHPHQYGAWEVTQEATCNQTGVQERKCFCGKKETEALPVREHEIVIDEAVAATCTENGLTEGSHCALCNKVFQAQEYTDKLAHVIGILETVAPTCTDVGYTESRGCTLCGYTEKPRETIAALGHTEETLTDTPATCTKEGTTGGTHCKVCNTILEEPKTIAKTEHTPVKSKDTPATCMKEGTIGGTHCSVCQTVLEEPKTIAKTEHTPVKSKDTPATCMKEGTTGGTQCSVCNTVLEKPKTIAKLAHKEVKDKAVAATCTKNGLTEGSHCSVCNMVIKKQETVAKTAHKEVKDKAVAATCTKKGKTEGSHCSVCNAIIKAQEETPTIAHKYSNGECSMCGVEKFSDGLEYTWDSKLGGYSVSDGYCKDVNVIIPSTYAGKPVKEVDGFYNNKTIESIKIPAGVVKIGEEAFMYCKSLKKIEIPSSVKEIGQEAFYRCESLTSLKLPSGITKIPDYMCGDCYSLETVDIPSSVKEIGERAFSDCALKSIKLPSGLKEIEYGVFSGCNSLKKIEWPSNLTKIGKDAFSYCDSLLSIELPSTITTIEDGAFSMSGSSSTVVVIPSSVTSMGYAVFSGSEITTIYCEVKEKPNGWDFMWNLRNYYRDEYIDVIWGYKK